MEHKRAGIFLILILIIIVVVLLTCSDPKSSSIADYNKAKNTALVELIQYLANAGATPVPDQSNTYILNACKIRVVEDDNALQLHIDIDSDGTAEKTVQIGENVTEKYAPFDPNSIYILKHSNRELLSSLVIVVPEDNVHTNFLADSDSELTIAATFSLYLPFMSTADLPTYKIYLKSIKDGTVMTTGETVFRRDLATKQVFAIFTEQPFRDDSGNKILPGSIDAGNVELVITNKTDTWTIPARNFL